MHTQRHPERGEGPLRAEEEFRFSSAAEGSFASLRTTQYQPT